MKKKNGTIEFLRFLFCIIVLAHHAWKYFWRIQIPVSKTLNLSFFGGGAIGVEFFFLVSGYLMCAHVYKRKEDQSDIPNDTIKYLWTKVKGMLPLHTITYILCAITAIMVSKVHGLDYIFEALKAIPGFFYLQMTGLKCSNPNFVEWYLSAMFIAMIVLYPLLRKYYDTMTKIVFPVASMVLIGIISYNYTTLTGVMVWIGWCYKAILRTFAELMLGCVAFELTKYLKETKLNQYKLINTIIWLLSMGLVIGIVLFRALKYEVYGLMALFVVLVLSFGNFTYLDQLFDNKVSYYLGSFSLPVYLSQVVLINICYLINFSSEKMSFIFVVVGTVVFGFILDLLIKQVSKYRLKASS